MIPVNSVFRIDSSRLSGNNGAIRCSSWKSKPWLSAGSQVSPCVNSAFFTSRLEKTSTIRKWHALEQGDCLPTEVSTTSSDARKEISMAARPRPSSSPNLVDPRIPANGHRTPPGGPQKASSSGKRLLQLWWLRLVDLAPPLGAPRVFRKAAFNVLVIAIFRIGSFIPLAGINRAGLPNFSPFSGWMRSTTGNHKAIVDNIFMLEIGPVAMAGLLATVVDILPSFRNYIQSKPGQEGNATQSYGRRWLALVISIIMGASMASILRPMALDGRFFVTTTALNLAAGSAIITHLVDEIRSQGLGDGIGLFIFTVASASGAVFLLMLAAIYVSIVEKQYNIVSYDFKPKLESKRLRRGKGLSNVMPLRIAPSGVSCLLTINLYGGLAASAVSFFRLPFVLSVPAALKPVLMAILAFLTVFIDLSFGRNAESMGEVMEQTNIGLQANPPLIPGQVTARFLSHQMSLAHFWGGLAVGLICGAAIGLDQYCRSVHSLQIGATTMLLLTGYITTIYRQVAAFSELPKLGHKLEVEKDAFLKYSEA